MSRVSAIILAPGLDTLRNLDNNNRACARLAKSPKSLGIEELRKKYANANLSIRPRIAIAQLDLIREFAKGIGFDPDRVQIEPDAKFLDPQERQRVEIRAYMRAIKDELQKPPTAV